MSDEFDDTEDPQIALASALPRIEQTRRRRLKALPRLIAQVYADAAAPLKVRLLEKLLQPVGPLAMAAIAAGAFGPLLLHGGAQRLTVPLKAAARVSSEQVVELALYVEQARPDVIDELGSVLADEPAGPAVASGSVLMLALTRLRRSGLRRR